MRYALNPKGTFQFTCPAQTIESFNRRMKAKYYDWKGLQAKGFEPTFDNFIQQYNVVKLTVEGVQHEFPR